MLHKVTSEGAAGKFRIHAVSEMTGVPSATLRAWERRYGIPEPARTASAYRLYSEHDVALVKRLRALCDAGMAIGEAAEVARNDLTALSGSVDPFAEASVRIVEATSSFDPAQISLEVARATLLGTAPQVVERVFARALHEIGARWETGELSIAQEHVATDIIGSTIREMARQASPGDSTRRVLLACFEDELHQVGLHSVALRLGTWGIDAVVMGARVPPSELARAVKRVSPDAVGLSITFALDETRARALAAAYAEACGDVPWFVGGVAVASVARWATERGAVVLDGDVGRWREVIERAVDRGARARASRG